MGVKKLKLTQEMEHALEEWTRGSMRQSVVDGMLKLREARKPKYSGPIYRGMYLTGYGASERLESVAEGRKKLKIAKSRLESWSSNPSVAWGFAMDGAFVRSSTGARLPTAFVLLGRKSPVKGSVVANLGDTTFWRTGLVDTSECEVVVEQQCKSCDMRDIVAVGLTLPRLDVPSGIARWRKILKERGFSVKIREDMDSEGSSHLVIRFDGAKSNLILVPASIEGRNKLARLKWKRKK